MNRGNWRKDGSFIVSEDDTGWDDEGNVRAYGGHLVCESVPSAEIGHLIAAAPEMYRALKEILELVHSALEKAEGREE